MTNRGDTIDCALFTCKIEDEPEYDEAKQDVVVPPGSVVLGAIRDFLIKSGFGHISSPVLHEYYAWRLDVVKDRMSACILVSNLEPWQLLIDVESAWKFWRFRQRSSFRARLVDSVSRCFQTDSRFTLLDWVNREKVAESVAWQEEKDRQAQAGRRRSDCKS